ncbi:MAG: DUF4351 domain-containing protein [Polyangiaceae bacterium]|nr:DUF4351 domain-containing protein [Polyangiaceae bacterium]
MPMVVHHSDTGWTAPTTFEALIDLDADTYREVQRQIPSFELLLDDVSGARDDELRSRVMSEFAQLALMSLARARSASDMLAELRRWSDVLVRVAALPNGVAALAALVSYILGVTGLPPDDLKEFLKALGPQTQEAFMTGADILREEGRKEGEAKGEAKIILRLLRAKFGEVPSEAEERLRSASVEQLDTWAERLLTAESVEEALA